MSYCKCTTKIEHPLHDAIIDGNMDEVKKLVEAQYDLEEVDCGGNTPLLLAIKIRNPLITKYLIDHGSNPNVRDIDNRPASFYIKMIDDDEILLQFITSSTEKKAQNYLDKIIQLKDEFKAIPDCEIHLKISLETWIPIVSSFLPNDTIKLIKSHNKIRIDFTLDNITKMGWKRGNNSIIVDLSDDVPTYYLDRNKKYYVYDTLLGNENKKLEENNLMTPQMKDQILGQYKKTPSVYYDINSDQVTFKPYTSWLNPDSVYMISEFKCFGYEMSNLLFNIYSCPSQGVTTNPFADDIYSLHIGRNDKVEKLFHLDVGGKFKFRVATKNKEIGISLDQELSTLNSENVEVKTRVPILPYQVLKDRIEYEYIADANCDVILTLDNTGSYFSGRDVEYIWGIKYGQKNKTIVQDIPKTGCLYKPHEIWITRKTMQQSATIYMSPEFPFTVNDVMPFAKIISRTNDNFEKFHDFFTMKFPKDSGFPVKADISIWKIFTLKFHFLFAAKQTCDASVFEIPADFIEKPPEVDAEIPDLPSVDDMLQK